MAIRRKAGVRVGIRRRMPVSATRQELLKDNLRRFQEVATRLPKATEPSPAQPKAPPVEKAKAAPVGEILPPERGELEAFSPGDRMMEANRHVQRSVREASLIIRDSEVFFLGAKQSVSVTAESGTEEAAEMVRKAERSVAEALEFVLGPGFVETGPHRKTSVAPMVEEVGNQTPSRWTEATTAGSTL